mgnify:CR=1 FL=1
MIDDCDEALANIYTYLDGELDDASVDHIRRHLSDCSPCEDSFHFEERLRRVVRSRMQEDLPPVVLERLRLVLEAERTLET